MTIRLYCDEDSLDRNLARALRARGMDVTTALEENMIARGDEEHLDYATHKDGYSLASIGVIFTGSTRSIWSKASRTPVLPWQTSSSIRLESKCVVF